MSDQWTRERAREVIDWIFCGNNYDEPWDAFRDYLTRGVFDEWSKPKGFPESFPKMDLGVFYEKLSARLDNPDGFWLAIPEHFDAVVDIVWEAAQSTTT